MSTMNKGRPVRPDESTMRLINSVPSLPMTIMEVGLGLSFVLMALFILTASLELDRLEKTLPAVDLTQMHGANESDSTENEEIVISITKTDGKTAFFVGEREVAFDKLPSALQEANAMNVAIRADNLVMNGTIMKVLKACKKSEVEMFTFVFEEEQ